MGALRQRYIAYTETERGGRLPALDGARVLFVLLVGAFHIWQQSWLTPMVRVGGAFFSFDPLLRCGYIWVDAMLLLSGFLLYLPYAEAAEAGKRLPGVLSFYRRRLLRIVPSYYLCVLVVLLVVALPEGSYRGMDGQLDLWQMGRDLLAHATFTHTLFPFSYTGSPLNGALWTLGVEMQFYLLFPLLGRLFKRWPAPTWLAMAAAAFGYRAWVKTLPDTTLWFNQLPAMLDVYANGMAAAAIYSALKRRMKQDRWTRLLFTAVGVLAVAALWRIVRDQAAINGYPSIREGQMDHRFPLSACAALLLLGLLYGARPIRFLFGNRVTRILSEVSFQFYMWHQVFAVQLKKWGIPASASENPWMSGDRAWQILYTALCFGGALAISAAVTYLFEQPIARRGRKRIHNS
ncbi:MAG: acyltransferase [Clostridia bacterium]|nr:acyltransferase [Clostridia bacterium]